MNFKDGFTREMTDWMARMRSETDSERKRMEMGDDLILMVQRSIMFWMVITSTRNTDMDEMVVCITIRGTLVTLAAWG